MGFPWLQSPVAVYWRRSHCKLSGLTWFDRFDIVFFHRPLPKHWKSTRLWRTSTCHGMGLAMKEQRPGCILSLYIQICQGEFQLKKARWWFQRFSIFTPIWGRFPIWPIFFRWVETTNQMRYCLILVRNISLALQVADCTPSLPLPSCFHPISEILGRSGPIAEHLSNTNVLQVSNIKTTPWFHFYYMIFRNLEPQTFVPGFCPFIADAIPWQVDVHHGLVDFQCCGKGLRTDNDGKPFQAWDFIMRSAPKI